MRELKITWKKENITIIRLIGSFPSNIPLMFKVSTLYPLVLALIASETYKNTHVHHCLVSSYTIKINDIFLTVVFYCYRTF